MEQIELGVKSRYRKLSKCKITVIVICIFGFNIVGGTAVLERTARFDAKCFLPQYDGEGKVLNSSVPCSSAMDHVFTNQYLPDVDIFNPTANGMKIFKPFPNSCFKSQKLRKSETRSDNYKDTESFYRKMISETTLEKSFAGSFTMGATLNVKTKSLSSGEKNVMGLSIELLTHTRSISLDENCYKSSSSSLTDDVLKAFDALPVIISKPWLGKSWQKYEMFFERFGTHFRTEILMGSSLRQWTFAEFSKTLTERTLQIEACLGLGSSIIEAFDVCSDIKDEEFTEHLNIATYDHLEIRGGTDATRNALQRQQTQELIEKLMNEGRKMESPVTYKYENIWDIFLFKYGNNKTRVRISENMKHYYKGYKDYGCTHIEIHGITARSFRYVNDDMTSSSFECVLAPQGCRSNNDCHGGKISVINKHAYCYGNTCFEYQNPPFGTKAESVSVRLEKKGDNDEGLNKGCIFHDGNGKCINENDKTVIWNIDGGKNLIIDNKHAHFNYLWLLFILPFLMMFLILVWKIKEFLKQRDYGKI